MGKCFIVFGCVFFRKISLCFVGKYGFFVVRLLKMEILEFDYKFVKDFDIVFFNSRGLRNLVVEEGLVRSGKY